MFGLIRHSRESLEVRRRIPDLPERQLNRLSDRLRHVHDEWTHRSWTLDTTELRDRLISAGIDERTAAIAAETVDLVG